ncbi:universal stress protein [Thalassospiraceae bacterium LMO-JJ14]|nr:universal stress protein [Thalassospiraceae bacterium LMO-JJ14]
MFKTIMVPVDLAHKDLVQRGVDVACDLAAHYDATMHLVGVTAAAPGRAAHSPAELTAKLHTFADSLTDRHAIRVQTKTVVSHDPAVDLEDRLVEAASEIGADLVVMSSHKPGIMDFFFTSHAGTLATHTDLSVFIVR